MLVVGDIMLIQLENTAKVLVEPLVLNAPEQAGLYSDPAAPHGKHTARANTRRPEQARR